MSDRRRKSLELLKETNHDTSMAMNFSDDSELVGPRHSVVNGELWIAAPRSRDDQCRMCHTDDRDKEFVHFDSACGEYPSVPFCLECLTGIRDVLENKEKKRGQTDDR